MEALHPWLVIVTGPPAAGKTCLAGRLAPDLGLPLFTKDGFKETLFDALEYGEEEWSRRLGAASFDLLFHAVTAVLRSGRTCMIEANFHREHSVAWFEQLAVAIPHHPLQIVCRTEPHTLAERYALRQRSGARHAGHHGESLHDPEELLQLHGPLALSGPVILVDNETEASQSYAALLAMVQDIVARDS